MDEIIECAKKKKGTVILLVVLAIMLTQITGKALDAAIPTSKAATSDPELVRHITEQDRMCDDLQAVRAAQANQTDALAEITRTQHDIAIILTKIQANLKD